MITRGVRCASCRRAAAGLALGLLLLAAPAARAADAIEVHGNRRVEAATIRSYFAAGAGQQADGAADRPLDEQAVDAGLKALYASGLFADAKVARPGKRLVVTVAEAPVIDRVAVRGQQAVEGQGSRRRDPVEGARRR